MARIITKQLALDIVKKLRAQPETTPSKVHDIYGVYRNNILVAKISIRRGSERDKGHDYIPAEMHVGPHFAKEFALCNRSVEDWYDILKAKGLVTN
jgi:hypothetical protein